MTRSSGITVCLLLFSILVACVQIMRRLSPPRVPSKLRLKTTGAGPQSVGLVRIVERSTLDSTPRIDFPVIQEFKMNSANPFMIGRLPHVPTPLDTV